MTCSMIVFIFRWFDSQLLSSDTKRSWRSRTAGWSAAALWDTCQKHRPEQASSDRRANQIPAEASQRNPWERFDEHRSSQSAVQFRQGAGDNLSSLPATIRRKTLVNDLATRVRSEQQERIFRKLQNGSRPKLDAGGQAARIFWESGVCRDANETVAKPSGRQTDSRGRWDWDVNVV